MHHGDVVRQKKKINERKVLKVNNGSQNMPMTQTPPMGMPQDMGVGNMGGDFMPQDNGMGGQQPMMGNDFMPQDGGMGGQSEFDTNFDPGVEADEDQDPKKFIQQLTGKLSQSLRKYNDENGQTDVDLSKYVVGMVVKQAMKGLSEQDAEEIIDKVQADEDFTIDDMGDGQMQPQPQDDNMGQGMPPMNDPNQGQMQPPTNESFRRNRKRRIEEIVNSVLDNRKNDTYKQVKNTSHFSKRPFISPNFEK